MRQLFVEIRRHGFKRTKCVLTSFAQKQIFYFNVKELVRLQNFQRRPNLLSKSFIIAQIFVCFALRNALGQDLLSKRRESL